MCYDAGSAYLRRQGFSLIGNRFSYSCVFFVLIALAAFWRAKPVAAQARVSMSLDSVLSQLDSQAGSFKGLSADVERTKVTVVVNDKSTDTGTILVRDDKMLLQMKPPDARTVLKTGDTLYVYTPGLKRVEEYNLGKNRELVDQFMLLGFGTKGSQLRQSYQVTVAGEPTLGDRRTVELELVPKSQVVKNQFSKIQIWYDPASWLAVQQQFYETGSGDYSIVRYSNLMRNPQISESQFKPHWPKGTEKIKPQG